MFHTFSANVKVYGCVLCVCVCAVKNDLMGNIRMYYDRTNCMRTRHCAALTEKKKKIGRWRDLTPFSSGLGDSLILNNTNFVSIWRVQITPFSSDEIILFTLTHSHILSHITTWKKDPTPFIIFAPPLSNPTHRLLIPSIFHPFCSIPFLEVGWSIDWFVLIRIINRRWLSPYDVLRVEKWLATNGKPIWVYCKRIIRKREWCDVFLSHVKTMPIQKKRQEKNFMIFSLSSLFHFCSCCSCCCCYLQTNDTTSG